MLACDQCSPGFLRLSPTDRNILDERLCGRPFCLASPASGVRGMDHGTEGRDERMLFPAHTPGLHSLRQATATAGSRRAFLPVLDPALCARTDVQAHARHT